MIESGENSYALGVGEFENLSEETKIHNYRIEIYFPKTNVAQMENVNEVDNGSLISGEKPKVCTGPATYTCNYSSQQTKAATCNNLTYSCSSGWTLAGTICRKCNEGTLSRTTCEWNCPEAYSYYQYELTIKH